MEHFGREPSGRRVLLARVVGTQNKRPLRMRLERGCMGEAERCSRADESGMLQYREICVESDSAERNDYAHIRKQPQLANEKRPAGQSLFP
jgi:hypothetical protein